MDARNEQRKVFETYEQLAPKILRVGYRHNPYYLARKAIVDWDLLHSIDISGARVLNVGCFEPIDELLWAELVREWMAIDASPASIAVARTIVKQNLAPRLAKRVKFRVMQAEKLLFKDEQFDIVTSFSVLDHIADATSRENTFREMARVVKRGGHVVVTVPNRHSYYRFMYRNNLRKAVPTDVGFQYFYSRSELKTQLQRVGLRPVRFTSDAKNVGDLPKIVRGVLLPLQRIGDRMGFLAKKADR